MAASVIVLCWILSIEEGRTLKKKRRASIFRALNSFKQKARGGREEERDRVCCHTNHRKESGSSQTGQLEGEGGGKSASNPTLLLR